MPNFYPLYSSSSKNTLGKTPICWKAPLTIKIHDLQDHVKNYIFCYKPIMQTPTFGGWSVLSANKRYDEGWRAAHEFFEKKDNSVWFNKNAAEKAGIIMSSKQIHPTEICTGYLAKIMHTIESLSFQPTRARIAMLMPFGKSEWHFDAPPGNFKFRLHIPIFTNEHCLFRCDAGDIHLPANGDSYILRVDQPHQIVNRSPRLRLHLLMDIKAPNELII